MTGLWWKVLAAGVGLLVGLNSIGIPMPWAINARLDAVEVRLGRIEQAIDRFAPSRQATPLAPNQDPAAPLADMGRPSH
jgi:hypothetical protein